MSDYYDEPGGYCEDCGLDLDQDPDGEHDDSHRKCWGCWRWDQGLPQAARRRSRPAPGTEPPSFVEGLARTREELAALRKGVTELALRVALLEQIEQERGRAA